MERTFRQSGLKRFKRCRRSYDLGYRRNLEPVTKKVSVADTGTAVHTGLQAYYLGQDPVLAIAMAGAAAQQAATTETAVDTFKAYELARIMVEGYIDWLRETGQDQGWEVIAVEKRLELPIGEILGDQVILTGQLDLIIRDAYGDVWVVDDKTCATFEQYRFNIGMNEQLLNYDMLVCRVMGITPAGCLFNMLRRVKRTGTAKPPFYARELVRFNEQQRLAYENQVIGLVTDMVAAEQSVESGTDPHRAMYPNPTADCSWDCSFKAVCPMFNSGEFAEDMIQDFYQVRPPEVPEITEDVA